MPTFKNDINQKRKIEPSEDIRMSFNKASLESLSCEQIPDKCYHVTFASNLDSIMREGLSPYLGGIGGASQGVSEMENQSKGFVHFSKEKSNVRSYKLSLQSIVPSKNVLILRVKPNKDHTWYPDPDDSNAIKTNNTIPIGQIQILTIENGKSKFVQVLELNLYMAKHPESKYLF